MDFIEIAKLGIRRWYITAPILAVSIVLALVAPTQLTPTYEASGTIVLSNPPERSEEEVNSLGPQYNPFLQIGLPSLALTVSEDLKGSAARKQVSESGLSTVYSVRRESGSSPLILIQAEADDPETATQTVQFLSDLIGNRLEQQQLEVGADEDALITALDVIPIVEAGPQLQSKIRVQAVILALGASAAILTAAIFDGWARHRRRRRTRRTVSGDAGPKEPQAARGPKPKQPHGLQDMQDSRAQDAPGYSVNAR